jgi:predicted CxxxxCH...CXXCH cytochrome family protein
MKQVATLAVLAVTTVVAACGGNKPSPAGTSGEQKGEYGVSYFVSVSRPVGGTITSFDGRIDCGTAGGTKNKCDPVFFAWGVTATFTATPDAGQFFQSWAGDCSGAIASGVGGCSLDTLTYGADKWVVAVFNPSDQLGHSRIPNPAQHSPLFFDFIKSKATPNPGVPKCTSCHGVNYDGVANAPSCTACHAAAGHGNWLTDCTFCHGNPPASHKPTSTNCNGCHPDTVLANGTINAATGKHMNGAVDVSTASCGTCHGFPPATGAHLAHYGVTSVELVGAAGTTGYGDLGTLETRFPSATPTTAPSKYAFGCGHCHPTDSAKHDNGTVDVDLAPAVAGSLKMRNDPLAAFNSGNKSCSGVYCHSSGQEVPSYASATPAWTAQGTLACSACHGNPPRYPSGGAGSKTANNHLDFTADGHESGHFLGLPGPSHVSGFYPIGSKHGAGQWPAGQDASPITCETCHYDTTDPSSRGPSLFYWLDTTGNYQLPGGSPNRTDPANSLFPYYGPVYQQLQCSSCHGKGDLNAPAQQGRVLPLRHVNGNREVVFDPRSSIPPSPAIAWLPPGTSRPALPVWISDVLGLTGPPPAGISNNGNTWSLSLGSASYDPTSKTCSSVGCHMAMNPMPWGRINDAAVVSCQNCHPGM